MRRAGRPMLPILIIVLATIVGIAALFAVWAKRQLLETQTWAETSEALIENQEIEKAVAEFITAEIYDNVDVAEVLADRLPPDLAPLSGPAAGALRNVADDVALKVLEQPKVQQLWVQANEAAHAKLIALIEDKGEFVSTTSGVVTLDLKGILESVTAQLGVGSNLVEKLPADAASIEVLRSSQLESAQKGVNALRTAAWVLAALSLILFALAIYLSRDRRREALRSVGIGFAVAGIVVLIVRGFAGDAVVSSLSQSPSTDAAVSATFSIGTSLLVESAQAAIIEGLLIVFAAWLAGPTPMATSIRRSAAPYLRQPRFAYGGLAAILLLLFWWDPMISTHRLVTSLLLIAVAMVGTEFLRRQVIREFPDRVTTRSPAGIAQNLAERMRAIREKRVAAAAPAEAPGEARLAALERLGRLRDSKVLDENEFAAEKARILAE